MLIAQLEIIRHRYNMVREKLSLYFSRCRQGTLSFTKNFPISFTFVNEIRRITVTYVYHDVPRVCYCNVHTRSISTLFAISSSNKNLLTYQFLITTPQNKKTKSTPRSASGNATTCCYLFLFLDKNPVTFRFYIISLSNREHPLFFPRVRNRIYRSSSFLHRNKHFLSLCQSLLSVITNRSLFPSHTPIGVLAYIAASAISNASSQVVGKWNIIKRKPRCVLVKPLDVVSSPARRFISESFAARPAAVRITEKRRVARGREEGRGGGPRLRERNQRAGTRNRQKRRLPNQGDIVTGRTISNADVHADSPSAPFARSRVPRTRITRADAVKSIQGVA